MAPAPIALLAAGFCLVAASAKGADPYDRIVKTTIDRQRQAKLRP
jgi:hypothetical protein